MDQIINYLLLTIIFVFDPLAIALVVAANFAFDQIRPKTRENLYGEDVKIKKEFKPEFEIEEEELEKRMDIIGQNGNDGLHYEKESHATPSPLSFAQESAEINRIMGKDLTAEQMERLKNSKLTRTFNSDDDLKIHY